MVPRQRRHSSIAVTRGSALTARQNRGFGKSGGRPAGFGSAQDHRGVRHGAAVPYGKVGTCVTRGAEPSSVTPGGGWRNSS